MLVASVVLATVVAATGAPTVAADPPARGEGAPAWVSEGCEQARRAAGSFEPREVCAVGSAPPVGDRALQTANAEARGRAEIEQLLDARVTSMLESFHDPAAIPGEVPVANSRPGEGATDPSKDVTRLLVGAALGGAVRRDLWVSPDDTVYALMVLGVPQFQRRVWADQEIHPALRAHVARAAARELDEIPAPPAPKPADPSSPVTLVTIAEIRALPDDVPVRQEVQPSTGGPVIKIDNPKNMGVYSGPFPIRVEFLSGTKGFPVDMDSLKLEYKKAWGIDITDRVREYIAGTTIDVAESNLPSGKHTVEIQIRDTAGNRSQELFTVTVD